MHHFYRGYLRIFEKKLKVNMCDVNLNVIEKFDSCERVDKEFLLLLKEFFRVDIETEENEESNKDCLELLGVFFAPKLIHHFDESVGNIFLSIERIEETSRKYNLTFSALYDFVEVHEKAHSLMSPEIMLKKETRYISKSFFVFFEEMLATLYALFDFRRHIETEKIKNFVNNQPFQYKAALLFSEDIRKVEELMITWLLFKADLLPKAKNDLYYEYIDLDFKNKLESIDRICLLKDIRDLADNNAYIKPSDVQRKLGIGYNKAVSILEKLCEYKEIDFIDDRFKLKG